MGGVAINRYAEVLNTEGTVIPGLYTAGEVTGAFMAKIVWVLVQSQTP